jgi:hypothetical protein
MFLQYAAAGAVIPLYSLRMQELGFSPTDMAWACATQAIAGLLAPLAGQLADRWLPAEHYLAGCAFLAGILLWQLANLTTPAAVFTVSLVMWLLYVPCLTLGTSISFTHLKRPEVEFGRVRLWGTVGWIAPTWPLSVWFDDPPWLCQVTALVRPETPHSQLADAFRLGAVLAFALASYALTLPHTPPFRRLGNWLAPLGALTLLRSRSFVVYFVCTFGLCVTIPFPQQAMPLLLADLGIPRPWLARAMPLAQITEIVSLGLLPMILLRLGVRGSMVFGLLAWMLYMVALTLGRPPAFVVASLTMNGICICCFSVAGQVFVNSRARGDVRTSAQALLIFTNSLGMVFGNLLIGWVRTRANGAFPPTFAVAGAITAALVLVFLLGFSDADPEKIQWRAGPR